MTFQKLKRCPYCMKTVKLHKVAELYFVTCDNTDCDRVMFTYYDSAKNAIRGWNENESERGAKNEYERSA